MSLDNIQRCVKHLESKYNEVLEKRNLYYATIKDTEVSKLKENKDNYDIAVHKFFNSYSVYDLQDLIKHVNWTIKCHSQSLEK